MKESNPALNYSNYLKVPEILELQVPVSEGPEHDEMLFIIIHQSYELWFKQLLHELTAAQQALTDGQTFKAIALLSRIRTIIKVLVAKIDILETMTPLQFDSFRERLGSSSGFQSAQFREVEAIFGRRDTKASSHLLPEDKQRVDKRMSEPSLWDSLLHYLHRQGNALPDDILHRNVSEVYESSPVVQEILVRVHKEDPHIEMVCERLVDIDEGFQEFRYRHVKMVERTIGFKTGTGGSSGAQYLRGTLFTPIFPDLWEIRNQF